jgi:hypothetical protein
VKIERTTVTIVCDQPATASEADAGPGAALTVDEIVWLAENGKVSATSETIDLETI